MLCVRSSQAPPTLPLIRPQSQAPSGRAATSHNIALWTLRQTRRRSPGKGAAPPLVPRCAPAPSAQAPSPPSHSCQASCCGLSARSSHIGAACPPAPAPIPRCGPASGGSFDNLRASDVGSQSGGRHRVRPPSPRPCCASRWVRGAAKASGTAAIGGLWSKGHFSERRNRGGPGLPNLGTLGPKPFRTSETGRGRASEVRKLTRWTSERCPGSR
jgi:hypothetical protein